jgi:hypothetical protein
MELIPIGLFSPNATVRTAEQVFSCRAKPQRGTESLKVMSIRDERHRQVLMVEAVYGFILLTPQLVHCSRRTCLVLSHRALRRDLPLFIFLMPHSLC